jgi:hypothetical protein
MTAMAGLGPPGLFKTLQNHGANHLGQRLTHGLPFAFGKARVVRRAYDWRDLVMAVDQKLGPAQFPRRSEAGRAENMSTVVHRCDFPVGVL